MRDSCAHRELEFVPNIVIASSGKFDCVISSLIFSFTTNTISFIRKQTFLKQTSHLSDSFEAAANTFNRK